MVILTDIGESTNAVFNAESLTCVQPDALGYFESRVKQLNEDGLPCLSSEIV